MKSLPFLVLSLLVAAPLFADKPPAAVYKTEENIPYYDGPALAQGDDYQRAQCRLDLYCPANRPGFATILFFHGGGLIAGKRQTPFWWKGKELGVVAVSYRLAPQAKLPQFLEDAGAATAWVMKNIAARGGDPKKVFVSGHSAGAWLAAMVGMDPRWLAPYRISNRDLAGIIPLGGQMTTHSYVRKLLGDKRPEFVEAIDEYAPLHYASKNLPPVCLVTGDRKLDIRNRMEENALMAASLRSLHHPFVEFYELQGMNHGTSKLGGWLIAPEFVQRVLARDSSPKDRPDAGGESEE